MYDVAVKRGKILVAVLDVEQISAHRHQLAGCARRAIQSAKQFLASWLGSEVKIAGAIFGGSGAPVLDGLLQPGLIPAVAAFQRLEEGRAAGLIHITLALQHFPPPRRAPAF